MPAMPKIKVFGGWKYNLGIRWDTKREANSNARDYRSQGYRARVVKAPNGYYVYYRYHKV